MTIVKRQTVAERRAAMTPEARQIEALEAMADDLRQIRLGIEVLVKQAIKEPQKR
ncbi:hypothetical protein E9232_004902 [Inquilinus ginsengisoli]|uniref:Uncharacterized protein n=1 Tax=Inquilinus ginsengisoli TaxID=363840 RepID=A0ABU1JVN7_9PROT|nr:hypothetical protein [Inquilinus ginsengisoli]MDR6292362.1 hypothetical protein [Inquilinus ginsengisoli]